MRIQYLTSCVAAFLLAALAPALVVMAANFVVAGVRQSAQLAAIAFFVSLGHTIFLGLPLFLISRSKGWVNAISATAGGFIVGIVPWGFLGWPLLVFMGSLGALGGFVFWIVLELSGGLAISAESANTPYRRRSSFGFAAISVLLTAAVVAAPSMMKDRSCHNMFRDGSTTISARLRISHQVSNDDRSQLKKVFKDFSARRELSFRASDQARTDVSSVLALSLCNDRGTNISVREQDWASVRDFPRPIRGWAVDILVYQVRNGSGWEAVARDLVGALESAWPGSVHFRDGNNRVIPMPEELRGVAESPDD